METTTTPYTTTEKEIRDFVRGWLHVYKQARMGQWFTTLTVCGFKHAPAGLQCKNRKLRAILTQGNTYVLRPENVAACGPWRDEENASKLYADLAELMERSPDFEIA
jgi:hypothetical protein